MFEAVAYFSVCAYFYWVSKYWHFVMLPTIVLALLGSSVVAAYVPESPRFLISQHKFDQARQAFQVIARYNLRGFSRSRRDESSPLFRDIIFKEEIDYISSVNRQHMFSSTR